MNIDIDSKIKNNKIMSSSKTSSTKGDAPSFADELSTLASGYQKSNKVEALQASVKLEVNVPNKTSKEDVSTVIDGLEDVVAEVNDKISKSDEPKEKQESEVADSNKNSKDTSVNDSISKTDNKSKDNSEKEDDGVINNNMNIPEEKDDLPLQMGANMNFSGDGTPFSDFMNGQNKQKLEATVKDLAEEQSVLSTMDENIMIANRNKAMLEASQNKVTAKTRTVANSQGIKKINNSTNISVETVVKYDSIIMKESDVDFFVKLVEKGQVDATEATAKSAKMSRVLSDLLAKAMKDNKPIRIDFDNNISVIIRIGRDGKLSADFLPSSQIAEAYLKENLPILKQRFDENNINYDELNHKQHKKDNPEDKKKGQKDE